MKKSTKIFLIGFGISFQLTIVAIIVIILWLLIFFAMLSEPFPYDPTYDEDPAHYESVD